MIFRSNIPRMLVTKSMWISTTRYHTFHNNMFVLSLYSMIQTLCPDSRAFVLYQLYPAWQSMRDIFRVNFIPYGKAYVSLATLFFIRLENGCHLLRCSSHLYASENLAAYFVKTFWTELISSFSRSLKFASP